MFRVSRALRPVRAAQTVQKRFLSIHEYRGAQLLKMVMSLRLLGIDCSMALVYPMDILLLHQRKLKKLQRSWVCDELYGVDDRKGRHGCQGSGSRWWPRQRHL